jgi:hypothetical protein
MNLNKLNSFKKTITKIYKPIWIKSGFSEYSESFKNIRDTMKYKCNTCIKCNHKFELNESIALACFEKIGNKVLCEACAKEISSWLFNDNRLYLLVMDR